MAGNEQSQRAERSALQIQAGHDVNITLSVPFEQISEFIRQEMTRLGGKVWQMAQDMVQEAGRGIDPVPMKILVQILQHASVEADDSLQKRWAALLANASTSLVHPAFPHILSRLSSGDATFLDAIYERAVCKEVEVWGRDSLGLLFSGLGLTPHRWAMSHGDYQQLGEDAVNIQKSTFSTIISNLVVLASWPQNKPQRLTNRLKATVGGRTKDETRYRMSILGFEFVSACRPPKKADST